ncbi:hypothetical protein HOLleu_23931 [Holothuria leucospilota]|uniref:Uncharacterized protein n=1 Tax=Holothuria leucospilota TaxID=206669 RepID=A0A9Q1BVZ8_HOLLE|nr:hypothetical protein HOLleu_23931 [Holothuria leucospilota]
MKFVTTCLASLFKFVQDIKSLLHIFSDLNTSGYKSTPMYNLSIFKFTEDHYQSETFTRSTNRDKYYLVKHVYSPDNGGDVIGGDELHRYLQC